MLSHCILLFCLVVVNLQCSLFAFNVWSTEEKNTSVYGVDVSFPIHHYLDKSKSPFFAKRYSDMMKGCYTKYSQRECDATERARLEMNKNQPATQHNYTDIGFKKLRAPTAAWEPLISFYEANKHLEKPEEWPRGNTYVNSWESPTYMVSFENRALRGGMNVKEKIWAGMKPILEEWTGKKLEPTSLYGIRVYKDGAMLSTHVDRLPLVSSCIIQVAQDVDEPWPIEVYDHKGQAYNVTMQPGDMVLYESHTVLHGRPFPLKGRNYANVFVHFQPIGHEEINAREQEEQRQAKKKIAGIGDHIMNLLGSKTTSSSANTKLSSKKIGNIGGHEQSNHEEDHVRDHLDRIDAEHAATAAEEVQRLRLAAEEARLDAKAAALQASLDAALEEEMKDQSGLDKSVTNNIEEEILPHRHIRNADFHDPTANFGRSFTPIDVHEKEGDNHSLIAADLNDGDAEYLDALRDAATTGDGKTLRDLLDDKHQELIHVRDENDWQLIHEVVRGGDLDSVKLLIELGADTHAKISEGMAALGLARALLEEDHPIIAYLVEIGAPEDSDV